MPDRKRREGGIRTLVLWLEAAGVELIEATAEPPCEFYNSTRLRFRADQDLVRDAVLLATDLGMIPEEPQIMSRGADGQTVWQLTVLKLKPVSS